MTFEMPRKKIYLGWKLHGRIVTRFAMYWALYHVIVWQALCAHDFLAYQSTLVGQRQIPFTDFLWSFSREHCWMTIFPIALFPILLWDIVRLTHRIVGPIKRLEGLLRRMAAGESIRDLKFRDGDLAAGLEDAFNRYLASTHAVHGSEALSRGAGASAHPAAVRTKPGERTPVAQRG